jgi:XTP/dITP diphosphohydrolase
MRVVLATGNAGKVREFAAMMSTMGFDFVPQSDFGIESTDETGHTFFENAVLKARHAAVRTGMAAMADDSGLEVDALDGAPGVFSARYAGPGASDEDNVRKLLVALQDVPLARRTARFRCVIALLTHPEAEPIFGTGVWPGRILLSPRGQHGFGYDPIFEPEKTTGDEYLACSAAEMQPADKHAVSHRSLALRDLSHKWVTSRVIDSSTS